MKPLFFTVTVAPLTVLPFQKTIFTYGSPTKLSLGTVVSVPLSGRTVPGIVLSVSPMAPETQKSDWLKNILSVEDRAPLTKKQIALATAISEMSFTPLGKVLKHFVPKEAKARKN